MRLEGAVHAIRTAVTMSVLDDVHVVRVAGDEARAAVAHLLPCDLTMRDHEARATLLLDERGRVLADVVVARQDAGWLLFVEGLDARSLRAHLTRVVGERATVDELSPRHRIVSINGPYAWQLMAALEGPGIAALRYMTLSRGGEIVCLRAGKTGEYGYDLVVPADSLAATVARIHAAGSELGLVEVDRQALSVGAFESGFFDAHHPGMRGLDPVELGLQWRVTYDRAYVGSEALHAARRRSPRRLTALRAAAPFHAGDDVFHHTEPIGRVVRAGFSPTLESWIGAALIDRHLAHSGIADPVVQYRTPGRVPGGPVVIPDGAPAPVHVPDLGRRPKSSQVAVARHHRRREILQKPEVVQDPEATAMGSKHQIVLPGVHHHPVHRHRREAVPQREP